ncbi:MAG: beta-lactamase family protein [Planctomycetes bacterium]|nr:beta-lactamase family protein [Planctomycetota bacterium]
MTARRLGVILAAGLAVTVSRAQESPQAELERIRGEHGVVALAACVVREGEVTQLAAAGKRRRGGSEDVTVDDRWHLGSCTKAMTATLCGMFVDEGRLTFETTLPELFPALGDAMHAGWREVTLRDLLRHRSGMCANPFVDGLWRRMAEHDGPLPAIRAEVAEELLSRAPEFEHGSFHYSNAGYIVAGAALERIGAKSWEDLMSERLFVPLGMTSAGFGPPGVADRDEQPCGHLGAERAVPVRPGRGADNPPALGPAGTVHASLRDWARFIALQLGHDSHDPPLIRKDTLADLHRPPEGGEYACGFGVTKRAWTKGLVLTHSGSNTMWYCVVWMAPADDFAVLVACNQAGEKAERAVDAVAGDWIARFAHPAKR